MSPHDYVTPILWWPHLLGQDTVSQIKNKSRLFHMCICIYMCICAYIKSYRLLFTHVKCVYICVHMCVLKYVYVCIYFYMFIYVCIHVSVHVHVSVLVCFGAYMDTFMYLCICACLCLRTVVYGEQWPYVVALSQVITSQRINPEWFFFFQF